LMADRDTHAHDSSTNALINYSRSRH
jgi:hypothetical protein